jgi:hypothetical protein
MSHPHGLPCDTFGTRHVNKRSPTHMAFHVIHVVKDMLDLHDQNQCHFPSDNGQGSDLCPHRTPALDGCLYVARESGAGPNQERLLLVNTRGERGHEQVFYRVRVRARWTVHMLKQPLPSCRERQLGNRAERTKQTQVCAKTGEANSDNRGRNRAESIHI